MSPWLPRWRPSKLPLQRVALIGAGTAGRAFALRCVACGFDVVLEDVMPSNLRRAEDAYAEIAGAPGAGSIRFALAVEDAVYDADIAIDFVPDELESKLEIFSLLDRMAPPRTILSTPTRALSLTDLASCTYRPSRCVGLRGAAGQPFEGPLELMRSKFSDALIIMEVSVFLTRLGIAFQLVDDVEEPMLVKNLAG